MTAVAFTPAGLMADHPGLRPVCFHSPYEAAAWSVIGQRLRMTQAAAIKARLAEQHGRRVHIAGQTLHAFPEPETLRANTNVPGLTGVKLERLHALADEYGLGETHSGDTRRLTEIADRWRPYRSWVALLLRARAAAQNAQAGP